MDKKCNTYTHIHASLWNARVPTVLSGPSPRVSCPGSVGSDFPLESWAILSLVLLLLPPCPAVLMSPFSPCIKTLAELWGSAQIFLWLYHFKNLYWICYNITSVKACGILVPQQGIKPAPLALVGEVLSTEPLGRSLPDSSVQSSLPSLMQIPALSLFWMLLMFFCVIHMGLELVLPWDTWES